MKCISHACYLLLIIIALDSCQRKDTFKEQALEVLKEHQARAARDNQNALEAFQFSEGVQEIMEWFNYITPLSAQYEPLVIETKAAYDLLVKEEPAEVKALFLDFRSDRELAKQIDLKRIREFKNLEYLETLGFDELPVEIYSLRKLRIIHTNSELDSIEAITNLKELEEFEAFWTDNAFPATINKLTKLKTLRIIGSRQNHTSEIFDLPNLESLWIEFNDTLQMKGISKLGKLKCLVTNTLTKEIAQLPQLKGLNIQHNSDMDYPIELAKLQSLTAFSMHTNYSITKAPAFVGKLKNLEFIEFKGCEKLAAIPDSYNALSKLKKFNVFYTAFAKFPLTLTLLSRPLRYEVTTNRRSSV